MGHIIVKVYDLGVLKYQKSQPTSWWSKQGDSFHHPL